MSLFRRRVRRSISALGSPTSLTENVASGLSRGPQTWDPSGIEAVEPSISSPSPLDRGYRIQYKPSLHGLNTVPSSELLTYNPKYPFGERSRKVRAELDPKLQRFVNAVADHWDVSLIEGYRSPERQLELYNSGASKVKVGKHNSNPSKAVDMAPYPIDWNDIDQFIRFTYFCKGLAEGLGIKVRNGADWDGDNDYSDHSFLDWVHWEV